MKIVDVAEYYSENGGGIRTYIQAKMRLLKSTGMRLSSLRPDLRTARKRNTVGVLSGSRSAGAFL